MCAYKYRLMLNWFELDFLLLAIEGLLGWTLLCKHLYRWKVPSGSQFWPLRKITAAWLAQNIREIISLFHMKLPIFAHFWPVQWQFHVAQPISNKQLLYKKLGSLALPPKCVSYHSTFLHPHYHHPGLYQCHLLPGWCLWTPKSSPVTTPVPSNPLSMRREKWPLQDGNKFESSMLEILSWLPIALKKMLNIHRKLPGLSATWTPTSPWEFLSYLSLP